MREREHEADRRAAFDGVAHELTQANALGGDLLGVGALDQHARGNAREATTDQPSPFQIEVSMRSSRSSAV